MSRILHFLLPVPDFEADPKPPAHPPHDPGAQHHVLDARRPQQGEGDGGEGDDVQADVVQAQFDVVPGMNDTGKCNSLSLSHKMSHV